MFGYKTSNNGLELVFDVSFLAVAEVSLAALAVVFFPNKAVPAAEAVSTTPNEVVSTVVSFLAANKPRRVVLASPK